MLRYLNFQRSLLKNCLGFIKKLVNTPNNPVAQIMRRLEELQQDEVYSQKKYPLVFRIEEKTNIPTCTVQEEDETVTVFSKLQFYDKILTASHPNNIVQLKNQQIFRITSMEKSRSDTHIKMKGSMYRVCGDLFKFPTPSRNVGIMYVEKTSETAHEISIEEIQKKCILTQIKGKRIAITLLH